MKATIGRKALLSALKVAEGVVEQRHTMQILSHVLVHVEPGRGVDVTATDLEVSVRLHCPTDGASAAGTLAVPAKKLAEIVRELPEDADVSLDGTEKVLAVSAGRARCRLNALAADEFPAMPGAIEMPVTVATPDLAAMLARTRYAVSSDESRAVLCGALCIVEGVGAVRLVATDGHRLATAEMALNHAATPLRGIVPAKALDAVSRVLSGDGGPVQLGMTDNLFVLERPGVFIAARLLEGTYPNYEQVIPKHTTALLVERDVLAAAVRRVSVVSEERTRPVKLALAPGELHLTSSSPDYGDAEEHIAVEYDGKPLEVGFNARYLLETLQAEGGEKIEVGVGNGMQPVRVKSVDSGEVSGVAVIMPMRI